MMPPRTCACRRWLSVPGLIAGALLAVLVVPAARAQLPGGPDTLYGALVMATHAEHPQAPPEALHGEAKNLEEVFGYNDFRVLGEKRKLVPTGKEDWLVSSRQFFLVVDTKHPIPGGYLLGLQLRQHDHILVDADANLSRDRPLFIRGPFVGQGQLLILLMVL